MCDDRSSTSLFDHRALAQPRGPFAIRSSPCAAEGKPEPIDRAASVITIVEAPLRNGETVMAGFQRKERELAELFATLPLVESRARHARLCAAEKNDPVAAAFARLTAERQHRLLGFLADARRRAAIASARR